MNIRWLRSNRTLLALLAVTMVTVGLLGTLVMRQQHDQPTETGQVYLDKAGGGTNTAVPLIPTNPPQAATGDHGVDSAPARQPAGTDSAPPDKPTAPANHSSNSIAHSDRSPHPETVAPFRAPGHSNSAAAGVDKPADADPPRDAVRPDPPRHSIPAERPSPPREPARPDKSIEPPTEPSTSPDHDKPGKDAAGNKPGKTPGDGKPGKPAGEGKPGKPAGVENEPEQPSAQYEPRSPGKPGKTTESAQPSDGNDSHGSTSAPGKRTIPKYSTAPTHTNKRGQTGSSG
jgi:hypothetical protein